MREHKGQQCTAMLLGGNPGTRGEDTKLTAELTGIRKRALWRKTPDDKENAYCNCVGLQVHGHRTREPTEKT